MKARRSGFDSMPVPTPRSACRSHKYGYFSQRDALLARDLIVAKRTAGHLAADRVEQRAYPCEWCPSWHLTSLPEDTEEAS